METMAISTRACQAFPSLNMYVSLLNNTPVLGVDSEKAKTGDTLRRGLLYRNSIHKLDGETEGRRPAEVSLSFNKGT